MEFKKGDIGVRIRGREDIRGWGYNENHILGSMHVCKKETITGSFYYSIGGYSTDFRLATKEEIKWFKKGITNINDIPKEMIYQKIY